MAVKYRADGAPHYAMRPIAKEEPAPVTEALERENGIPAAQAGPRAEEAIRKRYSAPV